MTFRRVLETGAQLPPVLAAPKPFVTLRVKVSKANTCGAGAVTVIGWLMVPVAPSSSVTVNVTVYVPAAAYVCVGLATVPAGVASPKFQL